MITVAVGDIHGCFEELMELLEAVRRAYPVIGKIVFIGDYVDRGPDSKKVIDYLMILNEIEEKMEVICLKGNHEDMMDPFGVEHRYWEQNGGRETLKSFEVDYIGKVPVAYIKWIQNLPLYHDDGLRFFVHAGVQRKPPELTHPHDMMWIRNPFLSTTKFWGRYIVHGHTPVYEVTKAQYRLNIDTACVFGNKLTAAIFNDEQERPIEIIQVNAKKDYTETTKLIIPTPSKTEDAQ